MKIVTKPCLASPVVLVGPRSIKSLNIYKYRKQSLKDPQSNKRIILLILSIFVTLLKVNKIFFAVQKKIKQTEEKLCVKIFLCVQYIPKNPSHFRVSLWFLQSNKQSTLFCYSESQAIAPESSWFGSSQVNKNA